MWVQNVAISYFHLSSPKPKPVPVHSTTPLALIEDRKPGNTNEVLPASRVQQYFSTAALNVHERSWQRNISLLECWRDDVIFNNVHTYIMTSFGKIIRSIVVWKAVWNGRSCSVLYLIKYSPSWTKSEIERKININNNLQLDFFRSIKTSYSSLWAPATSPSSNPVRLWQWFNLDKDYLLRTSKFQ